MKRLIGQITHSMMPLWIIFFLSYSCSSTALVPKLERRTLRISKEFAGFVYRYCVGGYTLFTHRCKKWQEDKYDLTDEATRLKLEAMGFVAVRRDRLEPK